MKSKQVDPQKALPAKDLRNTLPFIVAIGASAGGLDAFKTFLKNIPSDTGLAIVLVQHLNPNYDTMMPELLRKVTDMPVGLVKDKSLLVKNQVYIIPPDKMLTLEQNTLRVQKPMEKYGHRKPIDIFFTSLAKNQGEKAIAIILSGTGSDGALGMMAVKRAGGMTIAQSPDSAEYDSMPRNAVNTESVDFILPIQKMPEILMYFTQHKKQLYQKNKTYHIYHEVDYYLEPIIKLLKKNFGHDFEKYKKPTIIRRIQRRMSRCGLLSGADYLLQLKNSRPEQETLLNDLLIGVTYFFRDKNTFDIIKNEVLPTIFLKSNNKKLVRIWVAGCATGEEAYTMAMLLDELIKHIKNPPQIKIFSTDMDKRAIDIARKGLYPESIEKHIDQERIKKYFRREGSSLRIIKEIRDMCVFSVHDFTEDPPFLKIDLLTCRNVMIYMNPDLQSKVIHLFNYALKLDGYLLLGPAENIGTKKDYFNVVNYKHRIFRKKIPIKRLPLPLPIKTHTSLKKNFCAPIKEKLVKKDKGFIAFLEHFICTLHTDPFVVVNENHEIQYSSKDLKTFLSSVKESSQTNLIQLASPDIRIDLRTTIHQAIRQKKKTYSSYLKMKKEKPSEYIQIIVDPIPKSSYGEDLLLVIFKNISNFSINPLPYFHQEGKEPSQPPITQRLENELRDTKQKLKNTITKYEIINEELISSNEKIHSSNEELQTSQEEMQSINEELSTINSELNSKLEELDQANGDLINLLKCTQIATLFVDNDLKIKLFNPKAKKIIRLINTDVGRKITDISPNLNGVNLEDELLKVIKNMTMYEKIVQIERTNKWYNIEIHPYRTIKNHIDGAVITLYDITELKEFEIELSIRLEQQMVVANLGLMALDETIPLHQIFDQTLELITKVLKVDCTKILKLNSNGTALKLISGRGWAPGLVGQATVGIEEDSQAGYTLRSKSPVIVKNLSQDPRFKGPLLLKEHNITSGLSIIIQGLNRSPYGVLGAHSKTKRTFSQNDVQFFQSIANILSSSVERQQLNTFRERLTNIVQSTQDIILSHTFSGELMHWNPAAEKIYGYKAEEAIGKNIFDLIIPPDKKNELISKYNLLKENKKVPPFETERITKKKEKIPIYLSLSPIKNENNIIGVSAIARNISTQKNYEMALVKAKESAQFANDLKSRFLGILSHELRTPLSSVIGYTDICLETATLADPNHRYLKIIKSNGELIQRLLDDLMDISGIEGGKINITKKWFNPQNEFTDTFLSLEEKAKEKCLRLQIKWPNGTPDLIYTDPFRLKQVISNLGSNAVKYTISGDINVSFQLKHIEESDGILVVEVVDTGIGISPEKQDKIFDPFFRANPNLGTPGVGLGLYLIKQIVNYLGGSIHLNWSEIGRGSSFSIQVPINLKPKKKSVSPGPKSGPTLTTLNDVSILVAEDVEDLRKLIKTQLESVGAKVEVVKDGKAALENGLKNNYDIIILDLIMPFLDGIEVMSKLKANGVMTPIIALTAHATKKDRIKCISMGFDDYLSKPVTKNNIIRKILKLLAK